MDGLAVNPTASDCLGYFANKLNVDSDALVKKIYANALLDKDSLAASHLTSVVMDAMKSEMNKYARNTLRTMTIPQMLRSDEQETLKNMYPEYTMNFTNNTAESHNFAHASRIIETILCMNKLSYFSNYKLRKKNILLKDIGGNRVFHAMRGHTSVHVCAPILNHTDAHRKATSDWRLNTSVVSDRDYYRYNAVQLFKRPSTHYCTNLGQNCAVAAPALMFIHSIYDMTPTEVADSMSAADAAVAMGTYIYDPRILMYDTGKLPLLNVTWKKYVKNNKKYIDFTFVGDAQPVYTHSLNVYMSYLETTYIIDSEKKNFYTFQFNENRNGIQFFTVTRIDVPFVPESQIKINHTLISQDNFLIVTYYEWIENLSIFNTGKMRRLQLLVPTVLWEQAYDMLKQQSDGSFTIAKAMEFMICYNKKTIINGQTVSHHQKCSSQVLDKLAYALYVRVYIDKYLASNTLTAILDDINNVRELTKLGPIKAMYRIMKDKIKKFFFPTIDLEKTMAPYCAWAAMSSLYKYPVDVRDAVTFKTVNTILPEIVQLHRRNNDFGAIQELLGDTIVDVAPLDKEIETNDETFVDMFSDDKDEFFAGPLGLMPVSCPRSGGVLIDVPGDGNCFFHSTIHHMNMNEKSAETPCSMRNRVNAELRSRRDFMGLENALKSDLSHQLVDAGGNQPVCILVCKAVAIVYGFNLCVHYHKNDIFDHTELYSFDSKYVTYHYHFNSYGDSSVGHFQPIIYENKYVSCNEVTCDAELQLINNEIVMATDELLVELSHRDREVLDDARNRIQDNGILHGYVSDHVLPIISIFNDVLRCNLSGANVLDLCSAPGAVSQYAIEQGARIVVAVTDDKSAQLYFHENIVQNYIDITDLRTMMDFVKINSNSNFDIVVADGCGLNAGYEYNRSLIICELMITLSLLSDGGNLVIRFWRYKYLEQCFIVEILQLHFVDVIITRPYPLSLSDDVNYIVCVNYVRPSKLEHMETFLGMLVGNVYNTTVIPDIVINDINNYYNSLDMLNTFITNPGLVSDNRDTKLNYMKLIPEVELDYDMSGGEIPELRPVKQGFLTVVVQALLNDIDQVLYPYVTQNTIVKNLRLKFDVLDIMTNVVSFVEAFGLFCSTLTVSNINKIMMTKKITFKIKEKTVSFVCSSCNETQYIPRCVGFYACKCDCRTCLYAFVDDVLVCQSVLACTCNNFIRRGAVINSTMNYLAASDEYDIVNQICDDTKIWEHRRKLINSEYEKISKDLITRLGNQMSDVIDCDSGVSTDIDNEVVTSVTDRNKTVADAMLETVTTQMDKPELDEDVMSDDGTTIVRLKKAFHECYNIWKMTDYNHTVTLKRILNMVVITKPSKELNTYLLNADSEPYVRINNEWYPKHPTGEYMFEYNGDGYVEFSLIGDRSAIVSEYTKKKFEPTFLQKCEKYYRNLYKASVKTKFDLVSGVPGCGKTTYIMKNHKFGDLVLSATREGALEFRKRAQELGEVDIDRNYRTVYSYLYNNHDPYETVYVDEAMMLHPGMMYVIACASKCKRLVMVGDVRQIPYYVRIDYDAVYHKFDSVFPVTSYLHVSYRCPQDVAVLMRNYYDKFVSASKVVKSMNAVYISGKNDVPVGYDIYLTFSQSDKEILSTLYDNVKTIHEYQGKQSKRVALYRGSPTMLKLYDSVEHHIVALTRHTNTLTYFSVVQDGLYNLISNLKGGAIINTGELQYLTTSLFASNKYSIFHFTSKDMLMKVGVDCDIKARIKNMQQTVINKSLGGIIYSYDKKNNRYIFHMITHKKYTDKPELKYISTAIYYLNIWISILNVKSLHASINYNGNWYEMENTLRDIQANVVIHDPKGKYDRYRLADIIVEYHHEQLGPNQNVIDICRERDLMNVSKKLVVMPDVYVLVYTKVDIPDIDLQKKYHYVPISMYSNKKKNIYMNRLYKKFCILMPKDGLKAYDTINCMKFFSSALMKKNFRSDCDDLRVLQQFNDGILINAYGIDTSLDVKLVAMADVTYHIQDCSFDASSIHTPLKMFDCVKPRLSTAMCPPRPTNSLKEVLKAVEKRNCAVPKIQLTMDVYSTAMDLFGKFIRVLCVDDEKFNDIEFNKELVEDWLTTQDNNIINLIQKQSISDMALNKYNLTIKKNSKPLLDMSCVNTYAALQTVVYSSKDFNTYFCPIFRKFKFNLMSKLVDKVLLMADMPPHKYAEIMAKQLSGYDMQSFYSLEVDVSKYDKSQALVHLLVDCFILRHFGVSDVDVNRWFIGHVYTVLRDPSTRLTAYNYFQRKSGDPSTWILNTVQVLVMIVNVIDVSQWETIALILASGDDSEIISLERLRINQKRFADVFNYEVKVYDTYRSVYFCSKFLIFDSNNDVYMIPDLFKMIKKLGRHDLKNREHLVSYRKSVLDGLRDFIVPDRVKIEYVTALSERYKCSWFSYDAVVNSLFNLSIDDTAFENLYIKNSAYYYTGFGGLSDL